MAWWGWSRTLRSKWLSSEMARRVPGRRLLRDERLEGQRVVVGELVVEVQGLALGPSEAQRVPPERLGRGRAAARGGGQERGPLVDGAHVGPHQWASRPDRRRDAVAEATVGAQSEGLGHVPHPAPRDAGRGDERVVERRVEVQRHAAPQLQRVLARGRRRA